MYTRTIPRLSPALEAFCTRFAAGAGTLFRWTLTPKGEMVALLPGRGSLRFLCPLSAQVTLERGAVIARWEAATVYESFGLSEVEFYALINAADNVDRWGPLGLARSRPRKAARVALRQRLLRICGLFALERTNGDDRDRV